MIESTSDRPAFFGRKDELARLLGFLDAGMSGKAALCFVTGDAGAGKSALLEAFAKEAKQRYPDLVIAAGDCNPQTGTEEPYLPFREILSDLTDKDSHQSGPDQVVRPSAKFLQAARNIVAEHGPDLIDIFVPGGALITRVGAQAAQKVRARQNRLADDPARAGIDQGHLFEQYTNVLCSLSARNPLALFVDDLHWADQASTQLLFHLGRRLQPEPVLIIGAYRPVDLAGDEMRSTAPLAAQINELKRYHGDVWVDLGDIHAEKARAFVEAVIDAEPNCLDDSFRDALFKRTQGHALYCVELLQHLKDHGHLSLDQDGKWSVTGELAWDILPMRVEGIIAERAARLQPTEAEILESAAAMGESFLADVVAVACNRTSREVIRQLSGSLSRVHALVIAEGFEKVNGQRVARYRFRHNLFREYFYAALDPIERGLLHETIATELESLYADDVERHAVTLAWHFGQAGLEVESQKYHRMAGDLARKEFAHNEAISHYRSALAMLSQLGGSEISAHQAAVYRRDIHASLGGVLQLSGRFDESLQAYTQALALTELDDVHRQAGLHRGLAGSHERQRDHHRALEALEQATRLLESVTGQRDADWWNQWIGISMDRIRLHYWMGNVDAMSPLLERLESIVDEHGNAHLRSHFWTGQAMRGYRVNRFWPDDETIKAVERALAAAKASNNPLDIANTMFGMGFCRMLLMRGKTANEWFSQSLDLARRCGDRHLSARNLAYRSHAARLIGDADAVDVQLDPMLSEVRELGMHDYVGLGLATRSWLAWERNESNEAGDLAREALAYWAEHAPRYPLKWTALVPLLATAVSRDDVSLAREAAEGMLDPSQAVLSQALVDALGAILDARDAHALRSSGARALNEAREHHYL